MFRSQILSLGLLVLIVASVCHGQVSDDQFPRVPKRIGVSEFYGYVDRLQLSDAQQLEADRAYDEYLASFEPLRDEMIELLRQHPGGSMSIVEQDGIIGHLPALCERMQAIDNTLFDRLADMLGEGQGLVLERIRMSRERTMLANLEIVEVFIGGGVPCLTDLFAHVDAPKHVIEIIDPLLIPNERMLTGMMRDVFHAAVDQCTTGDDDAADRLVETVRGMRELNRRTFASISRQLPADLAERWYAIFYRYTYPPAWWTAHSWLLAYVETALESSPITAEERAELEAHRRELIAQRNGHLEELSALLDQAAIRRAEPNDRLDTGTLMDRSNEIRRTIGESQSRIRRELRAKLGDRGPAPEEIKPGYDSYDSTNRRRCDIVTHTYHIAPFRERRNSRYWSNDEILVRPISPAEFDAYLAILKATDEQASLAAELYAAYRDELDAETKDKRRNLMMSRSRPRREFQGVSRWEKTQKMRAELREVVAAADEQLLNDLAALVDAEAEDPAMARVLASRHRSFWRFTMMMIRTGVAPNKASDIDLVVLLAGVAPEVLDDENVTPVLDEYDESMRTLTHERWEAFIAREAGMDQRNLSDVQLELQVAARHAHHALAAQNHQTAVRLAEALGDERGAMFFDRFAQQAYPDAFDNPSDMSSALKAALALDPLLPTERDALVDVQSEYHTAMDDVRQSMIELCAAQVPDFLMSGWVTEQDRLTAEEQYSAAMRKLRDEQSAINRAALRRLRSVLSKSQLQSIPLPEMH